MEQKADILRIEKISLADGAGMRTVVFFKGCPLRCAWCSTPESQEMDPEVYYRKEKCRSCGRCIALCPNHALTFDEENKYVIRNRHKCANCKKCAAACLYSAQQIYGKEMTVSQVMKEIRKDELFFFHSVGGVTLSGGDPFCYTDFAEELLIRCKDEAVNTCAELAMLAEFKDVERIVPYLDSFFVDIKIMDPVKHKKWTGRDNASILKNIAGAAEICNKNAMMARVPLIWDINNDPANIRETADFYASLKNCAFLEFLPYHRLGVNTYERLGRGYALAGLKNMSNEEVYGQINFLFDKKWPFDIKISGKTVYQSQI